MMSRFEATLLVCLTPLAAGLAVIAVWEDGHPPGWEPTAAGTPEGVAASSGAPEQSESIPVRATVYWAVEGQTDGSPLVTADGSRIDLDALENGSLRWCAVSRDLLARWGGPLEYGDTVRVSGCGDLDGLWTVRDTMARRFGAASPTWDRGVPGVVEPHALEPVPVDGIAHIDLLVPRGRMGVWDNAEIRLD